jgi:ATP-dependent DNA ligase
MANETIELLQNYDKKLMKFPAAFQQKFDGVPVRIMNMGDTVRAFTRQGEVTTSINHILHVAKHLVLKEGASIVGELYIPGKPHKYISGQSRLKKAQAPELLLYVFDFDLLVIPETDWLTRHNQFTNVLAGYLVAAGQSVTDCPIRRIPSVTVHDDLAVQTAFEALLLAFPAAEGACLHSFGKPFQPGKRVWGTQRIKQRPTIDLRIMDFEEAVSKSGEPLGMVGRLNAELNRIQPSTGSKQGEIGTPRLTTAVIGVGPGALTHDQRKALWKLQKMGKWKPTIAEVRHMADESYSALREPTFVRFRTDKAVPDHVD